MTFITNPVGTVSSSALAATPATSSRKRSLQESTHAKRLALSPVSYTEPYAVSHPRPLGAHQFTQQPIKLTDFYHIQSRLLGFFQASLEECMTSSSFDKNGRVIPISAESLKLSIDRDFLKTGTNRYCFTVHSWRLVSSVQKPAEALNKDGINHFIPHPQIPNCLLEVTIKLNEFADRLHLNTGKINDPDQAKQYLTKRIIKLLSLDYTVDSYALARGVYPDDEDTNKPLINTQTGFTPGINSKQLMKIIRQYYRVLFSKILARTSLDPNSALVLSIKDGPGQMVMLVHSQDICKRFLNITRIDNGTLIGVGAAGNVFKISQVELGKEAVLKLSHSNPQAKEEVNNERAILRYIHQQGTVPHIQTAPVLDVDVSNFHGFIDQLYDGDGHQLFFEHKFDDRFRMTLQHKLEACRQILEASVKLEELRVVHGDNKLENLFFKFISDKSGVNLGFIVFLADFGGARLLDGIRDCSAKITHTPDMNSLDDIDHLEMAIRTQNLETYKRQLPTLDVFQRGCMLYSILTDKHDPFPVGSKGYLTLAGGFDPQNLLVWKCTGYCIALNRLLSSMLHPVWSARPTFRTALNFWYQNIQPQTAGHPAAPLPKSSP